MTRGRVDIDADSLRAFIDDLDIPAHARDSLLQLSPDNYLGNAAEQARGLRPEPDGNG